MTEQPTYLRGHVVTVEQVIDDGIVVVDGDTIVWVGSTDTAAGQGWPDAPDAPGVPPTLLPELVDLHNHGGGGAGFPDVSNPERARVAIGEHLSHAGGVPQVDAARAASTTPAKVLGQQRVGALQIGRRADVVITDSDLRVVQVLRAGKVVHVPVHH